MKASFLKRLSALLLAVLMMLSLLTFAFAEGEGEDGELPPTEEQEIIPLNEGTDVECTHVAGNTVNTATCVAEGTITVYCGVEGCGAVISTVEIPATGHAPGETTVVVDASCTEAGSSTATCTLCSEVLTTEIPATGHAPGEATVVDATCTEAGSSTATCALCSEELTTEIPAIGHIPGEATVVDATCTEAGSSTATCTVCGEELTVEIPAAHTPGEPVVVAATCTTDGSITVNCTVDGCGALISTETIPAGHKYENGVCTACGAVQCIWQPDCTATEHEDGCIKGNVDKAAVLFDALVSELALSDTITDEVRESVYLQMYSICGLEDNYRAAWAAKPEFAEYQTSVWNVIVDKLNLLVNELPAADSITEENFDSVKAKYDKLMLLQEAYRQYWYRKDREPDFYNLLMANANFSAISEVIARGAAVTDTDPTVAEVDTYEKLVAALADTNVTTIKLTNDIYYSNGYNDGKTIKIESGKNITLDLNGHTLGQNVVDNGLSVAAVAVRAGAILTIKDDTGNGKIAACNTGIQLEGVLNLVSGTISVEGSSATDRNPGQGWAYPVWCYMRSADAAAPVFNMTGGALAISADMMTAHSANNAANAVACGDGVDGVDACYDNVQISITNGSVVGTVVAGDKTTVNVPASVPVYRAVADGIAVAQVGETKYTSLQNAINNANGDTVTLLDDIILSSTDTNGRIEIPANAGNITLDLNNHSITASARTGYENRTQYVFDNYADLTITGPGTISGRGIQNYGTLTITDGVTVDSVDANGGACVYAYENSRTFIQGGNFNAYNGIAGSIYSAGDLTITGGTFITKGNTEVGGINPAYAIIFNGGTGSISNATVEGAHGAVAVSGGDMTINGGTYTSTGYTGSDHSVYISDGTLTIIDGTFNGTGGVSSSAVYADADADKVEITGGTFTGNAASVTDVSSKTKITGGSFNKKPAESLLEDGYEFKDNGGTFSPAPDTSKAVENSTTGGYYDTLSAAVAAANPGDTIELHGNVTEEDEDDEDNDVILIDKSLTIKGNGHSITSSASRVIRVTASGVELTMDHVNMVSNAVRVETNDIRGISIDTGITGVKLTMNNCSVDFTHDSANDWSYGVNVTGGSGHTVTITGGSYEGANVINVWGNGHTITVEEDATLNSLYAFNKMSYGVCVKVNEKGNSTFKVTDCTFSGSHAVAFEVSDSVLTENNNTNNTKRAVAMIGNSSYYYSLADAVAAEQSSNATITLINNEVLASNLVIDKSVTVDPNGKSISSTGGKIVIANDTAVLKINDIPGKTYSDTDIDHYKELAPGMCVSLGSIEIRKDHTGGTATCSAKAKCTRAGCGEEYGEPDDNNHSFTYTAKDNVITETCTNSCDHKETASLVEKKPGSTYVYNGSEIKPLTIAYSKGWQGGNLDSTLTYADNKDIGTAKGTITKTYDTDKTATASAEFKISAITYTATPNNLRYVRGSGYPLSFTTNVPYNAANALKTLTIYRANGTLVMNVPIDPNYVVVSANPSGMTVITLTAAVMNSLEALNYELVAEFEYGDARTPFRVLLPFIFPMTGDEANVILLATISLVALGGVTAIVLSMKKKQYKGRH